MSHRECLWGSFPSPSDGGTGSRFGKSMDSTTTSTPNWRVLSVSGEKQNYGKNWHLTSSQTCSLRVWIRSELHQNLAIVCCLNCVSHPIWAITWGLPHCLFVLERGTLLIWVQSLSNPFSSVAPVSLSAHFSANSFLRTWQRCSWSCGGRWKRTAHGWTLRTPRSDALGQDVPSHSMEKKKNFSWKMRDILFDKQTPHYRKLFRECTKIRLISTHRGNSKEKQRRALYTWDKLFWL